MSTAAQALPRDRTEPLSSTPSPKFLGAVGGELLKLSRQRATWVMLGFAVLLFAVAIGAIISAPDIRTQLHRDPRGWYSELLNIFTSFFNAGAGIFLLIVSARLVGMEYSAGTIRVLLGRGTGRLTLLGAKLVTLALTGLALLAGFLIVATIAVYLMVVSWEGSFSPIASLPSVWHDLGLEVLIASISIGINILLGTAAAVVGRSLAFGIGAALAFYPADNFGTLVMNLVFRLTHQQIWNDVTAYLLGPNLNVLQSLLIPGQRAAFAQPLVAVDARHTLIVVGVYAAVFLIGSIVLMIRRDVLQ
ncbi:MAG TPA: ABC transporter permease [Candidatus Dormibacteraeota bacterium]|nr:ABC transporter permease [Candidatus Dormibacteraeota bacterium]